MRSIKSRPTDGKARHVLVAMMAAVILSVILAPASVALAASPANDDLAGATVISSLPFTDTIDSTEAGTEPNEPQYCFFASHTLWYTFTPAETTVLRLDTAGSAVSDTVITVYQSVGPGFAGLSALRCAAFGNPVTVSLNAGSTYLVQVGSGGGGLLQVNAQIVPPPANDDFAAAALIAAIPFDGNVDMTGATVEPGEPHAAQCIGEPSSTAWYTYTPDESGFVTANVGGSFSSVAIYTGSSFTDLSLVGCQNYGGSRTFHADAGTTYHVQVVLLDQFGGQVSLRLFPAPDPVASMTFQPTDPSTFDSIQFFDLSFDPGGEGLHPGEWTFGDGSTATGCCPVHRYAADGDYSVQLAATTTDGRSASVTQTLRVRTHDVAITKIAVPQSASAGQTRQISVGVNNRRYPETVNVELYRSSPTGFQLVGMLTQSVPVRAGNRTTDFAFSYTFTAADASIGKVTFRAVANLQGARDALFADNELIATPTKIAR